VAAVRPVCVLSATSWPQLRTQRSAVIHSAHDWAKSLSIALVSTSSSMCPLLYPTCCRAAHVSL
jgi:hypothetical protein